MKKIVIFSFELSKLYNLILIYLYKVLEFILDLDVGMHNSLFNFQKYNFLLTLITIWKRHFVNVESLFKLLQPIAIYRNNLKLEKKNKEYIQLVTWLDPNLHWQGLVERVIYYDFHSTIDYLSSTSLTLVVSLLSYNYNDWTLSLALSPIKKLVKINVIWLHNKTTRWCSSQWTE